MNDATCFLFCLGFIGTDVEGGVSSFQDDFVSSHDLDGSIGIDFQGLEGIMIGCQRIVKLTKNLKKKKAFSVNIWISSSIFSGFVITVDLRDGLRNESNGVHNILRITPESDKNKRAFYP